MPLFSRRRSGDSSHPRWTPTVDLATARPAIHALASTPALSEPQVSAAIARFAQLSDAQPLEQAVHLLHIEPDVSARPWKWLMANLQRAAADGDHHLVLAGVFWSYYWHTNLVPRNNNLAFFLEMRIDPIPLHLREAIINIGAASAGRVPQNFTVAGDASGTIEAGTLMAAAHAMLAT